MIKSTPCQSLQQMQQRFLKEAEEDVPCPCWSRGDGTSQDKILLYVPRGCGPSPVV